LNCKIQVFKNDLKDYNATRTYRFAVVDSNKSKSYPANFICMLPLKPFTGKANSNNTFSTLFGDNGREIAIGLLSDALKTERDADVKTEIERRIKLLDPKESTVKCSKCKKDFSPRRNKKYAQYLCDACLAAKRFAKTP
jgi:hypothetical protein